MSKHNSQRGLALIELLIVVVIMELLAVLVYVSISDVTSVERASEDKITTAFRTIERIFTKSPSIDETQNGNSSSDTADNSPAEKTADSLVSPNSKPTFSSSYQISTSTQKEGGKVSDIKIEITPLDLAERKIDGIKLDLAAQGLPTPSEAYAKINSAEEKSVRDWTCQLGPIIICQGPTVLVDKLKSTFDLFFAESIGNAPANLAVDLLENGNTAATLSVPLQNP